MNPITLADILPPDRYPEYRGALREAVIAHKRDRRLAVGEQVTLLFEDRETVRFQIQEMVWVERIADPARIQDEIDVYRDLLPGELELSATLFIEITEVGEIRPALDRLVGIHEHVALVLGAGADASLVPARFDPRQMEDDRISAVHFLRFRFRPDQALRLADPATPARLRIDHPAYRREADLPPALRASLCHTLAGDAPPLLPPFPAAPRGPIDLIFETPHVRARRVGAKEAVVETRRAGVSLLGAPPELLGELLDALQRVAAELVREHGRCRIELDVDAQTPEMRWRLRAGGGESPGGT
jgi:hypothetical protein